MPSVEKLKDNGQDNSNSFLKLMSGQKDEDSQRDLKHVGTKKVELKCIGIYVPIAMEQEK